MALARLSFVHANAASIEHMEKACTIKNSEEDIGWRNLAAAQPFSGYATTPPALQRQRSQLSLPPFSILDNALKMREPQYSCMSVRKAFESKKSQ